MRKVHNKKYLDNLWINILNYKDETVRYEVKKKKKKTEINQWT